MADVLRVGIVGSKFAAEFHYDGYQSQRALGVQVAGCYSPTKKNRDEFAASRGIKSFESFEEMCDRIDFLRAPDKLISKRIELELTDPNQKYRLFTRPPVVKGHF